MTISFGILKILIIGQILLKQGFIQIKFESQLVAIKSDNLVAHSVSQYAEKYGCIKLETNSSIELQQQLVPSPLQIYSHENTQKFKSEKIQVNSIRKSNPKSAQFTGKLMTIKHPRDSSTVSEIDSDDDGLTFYENKFQEEERKEQELKRLAQKKIAIGGGFNLDMSDFFKFKSKKNIQSQGFKQLVVGGHLAWIILLYSVCNAAIMPAWIMSIKANKILRISWRFLLQAIFMIPFMLYERRTGNQSVKKNYSFEYITQFQGLKKAYISSIGTSIWFSIILSCFEWTYISHSLVLGSLSNFFLSINRSINHSTHSLEPGGQIFVVVGILFTLSDSYMLDAGSQHSSAWQVINPYYLTRLPIQRVLADLAALSGAFIISRFSQKTADLKTYYPPFLSMFLVNIFVSIHVGLAAYFINGATFDRDTLFGIWGLFTGDHFGGFFYMAVVLSFGTYLSFTLISKLFTDPIIPALAMTLEPFFATFFLNLISVQSMPGSFSIYGYVFVICGIFLILIGQFVLKKENEKKDKLNQMQSEMQEKMLQKKHKIEQLMIEEGIDEDSAIGQRHQQRDKHKNYDRNHTHSDIYHLGRTLTI